MASLKTDSTSIPEDKFVASVRAKIAALQNLLAAYLAAGAVGALGQVGSMEGTAVPSGSADVGAMTELPEGAFINKSVPACIELYLSTVGMKKKSNKEIADALKDGGVESNADKGLDNTVAGALFKLKKAGRVLRFKDGWGLASNYPAHIRGAASSTIPAKKQGKNSKKKRSKKSNNAVEATSQKSTVQEQSAQGSAQERIVGVLRSQPNAEFSSDEIAHALSDIKGNVIRLLLGRLTDPRRKLAEKTESGKYRLVPSNIHHMSAVS